ncbi:Zinc transporter 8 [Bienertia sinuspersici]
MALCFTITTPLGVAIGIGLTNVYDETSPITLIGQGLLNSIAAGILIYMALVDLLAPDFMDPKIQTSTKLFFGPSNLASWCCFYDYLSYLGLIFLFQIY